MRQQHEDNPGNSHKKRRAEGIKRLKQQTVAMRDVDDEILLSEAKETINPSILKPNIKRPRIRKKSFLQKAFEAVVDTGGQDVGQYVVQDVLLPAAKTTIQDMITTGVEMLLFGESTGRRRSLRKDDRSIISYGSYYGRSRERDRHRGPDVRRVPSYHNRLEGITFESRVDASTVLGVMVDTLETYGQVSISDYYETAGIENQIQPSDNSWGWTDLTGSRVYGTRGGFEISFPDIERLED